MKQSLAMKPRLVWNSQTPCLSLPDMELSLPLRRPRILSREESGFQTFLPPTTPGLGLASWALCVQDKLLPTSSSLCQLLFSDTDSPSCPGGLELLRPPEIPGWLAGGMSRKTSKLEIETVLTGSSMPGSRDTLKIAM